MGSTLPEFDARHIFEYFIVAGLRDSTQDLVPLVHEGSSVSEPVAPITDICVIFPGLGETVSFICYYQLIFLKKIHII